MKTRSAMLAVFLLLHSPAGARLREKDENRAPSNASASQRPRYKMKDLDKIDERRQSLLKYLETTALFGVIFCAPHAGINYSSGGAKFQFKKDGR